MPKPTVVLYPTNKGRYYLRVRGQSVWLTPPLYKRLSSLCVFQIFKPSTKTLQPHARLEHRRVVFNTADRDPQLFPDPGRFAVPLETAIIGQVSRSSAHNEALGLPRPHIVGIRLHSAVVPRRQLVFTTRNNTLVLHFVAPAQTCTVTIPSSANRAGLVAAHIQQTVRETVPSFACCFHSGTKALQLSVTDDRLFRVDPDASTGAYELGFRALTPTTSQQQVVGQPLDFSGSRYLQLHADELKGVSSLVACVPMNDPQAIGLVYYTNPETGGPPQQDWPKPRRLTRLTFSVLNDAGQPYDFQGGNSCYVFEITCIVARPA